MLCVRYCEGKGRGVFAEKRFVQGEVIERSPVIILPDPEWEHLEHTALKDYYFCWGDDAAVIALGLVSIYNHSYAPNAAYVQKRDEHFIKVIALRDIEIGEEITFNYNGPPDDRSAVWFEVKP